ncbi:MAG: transposase family protein [Proteobacteria bacterium]|nr:transposase family protein [Pseudomonadota bacterium]
MIDCDDGTLPQGARARFLGRAVFAEIPDRRVARTRAHPLVNVLTMAWFGAICGADGWEALETFAEERAAWSRT